MHTIAVDDTLSYIHTGGLPSQFSCYSDFITSYGSLTYVSNMKIPGLPSIICSNTGTSTYTIIPSLSTTLGGNVTLSSSTGVISGTPGPLATAKSTLFNVIVTETSTGLSSYFVFYLSISTGKGGAFHFELYVIVIVLIFSTRNRSTCHFGT